MVRSIKKVACIKSLFLSDMALHCSLHKASAVNQQILKNFECIKSEPTCPWRIAEPARSQIQVTQKNSHLLFSLALLENLI